MNAGRCRCKNRVFFNNLKCLSCDAELGFCLTCDNSTSATVAGDAWSCDSCEAEVYPCVNRKHRICNCFTHKEGDVCNFCSFTVTIPDLSKPENIEHWRLLEQAKRRLICQLKQLGFPPFVDASQGGRPLRFSFLEDTVEPDGTVTPVVTGHAEGLITINVAEADSVNRERIRVQLGEPQRTLIGHMRHEVGHYINWALTGHFDVPAYTELFGDPDANDYDLALDSYYKKGAPANWHEQFVSAYATMHPWEDFAETVNAYLDILAIATTARDLGDPDIDLNPAGTVKGLIDQVLAIAVEVSEYNLVLGVQQLLPEKFSVAVVKKLNFIHSLRVQN